MRSAFYQEGEFAQVVLTPETEHERTVLKMLKDKGVWDTYIGGFYHCRGGWLRQSANGRLSPPFNSVYGNPLDESDTSLILVLKGEEPK